MEHTAADADAAPVFSPEEASDLLINWDVVRRSAALAPAGPRLSAREVAEEVSALREAASASVSHVHRLTGLAVAEGLGARPEETLVVDRATWAAANARSFRTMLGPAMQAALESRPELAREGSSAQVFGSAITGSELGGVLAFLSANVLGQFDPFDTSAPAGRGHLMLVAPTIAQVRRELNVVPEDFRLWVCLHEQTHRVQFAAAPWLVDHLMEQITVLSRSTLGGAGDLGERLREMIRRTKEAAGTSGEAADAEEGSTTGADAAEARPPRNRLIEAVASEEGREAFSRATATMSLLEGHANHIMDAVDSSIVPSVKTIRRRFERRGRNRGMLDRAIRRLLQLDVKARQYRDGQRFVDHVVAAVGMEQFNRVWESAEHLPSETELHDPDRWIARMELPRA
ncbi:zinc-dependent metalloprotease [Nesterenkonia sp. F]|uniref:zinc-dependent metalloprotease n=1 Tax=Nesterenkonia sp. F TaxID=795955 RepID=UPI000255CE61|nr:zinc-dependent metalloprotease [Nesterenkonia sp. F]